MISLLHGCFQVELTVSSLDSARAFMTSVLDARPIEQELAREIQDLLAGSGYRVDHLDCGQATFQVNQPPDAGSHAARKSVHQINLQQIGPCVSNLNFYVDDIAHARNLLSDLGAQTRTEGPSTLAASLADYGSSNTRPGGETRPFLFMGTRDLIGLDLEIMEPNFERFSEQTAQYPCYVRPGRHRADVGLRLERLRIAVRDLRRTYANLTRIFSPASRSHPYGLQPRGDCASFRVWLGGIELEYCQPSRNDVGAVALLSRYGPGVIAIEFSAIDPARVAERARVGWPLVAGPAADPSWEAGGRWLIGCRDVAGFDVELVHRKGAAV